MNRQIVITIIFENNNKRTDLFIFRICIHDLFLNLRDAPKFIQSCMIIEKLNLKFEIYRKMYFQSFYFLKYVNFFYYYNTVFE